MVMMVAAMPPPVLTMIHMAPIHVGVPVFPIPGLIAAGVRIARSLVLTIGVRIELRTISRIGDHFLGF